VNYSLLLQRHEYSPCPKSVVYYTLSAVFLHHKVTSQVDSKSRTNFIESPKKASRTESEQKERMQMKRFEKTGNWNRRDKLQKTKVGIADPEIA
jgi:hypothetical protein